MSVQPRIIAKDGGKKHGPYDTKKEGMTPRQR
jgi:hypothetical protein